MNKFLVTISLAVLAIQAAFAVPAQPTQAEQAALGKAFEEIRPQTGAVVLKDNLATINVPEGLQFLNKKDAEIILVKIWGNPPESVGNALGMLVTSPRAAVSEGGWGIVVTYTEDGHIDDADAMKTDYTALLKTMQEGIEGANKERAKGGYSAMSLKGWAEPPHYDAEAHKIYWAKELAFEGHTDNTLNYCTRILGRRGVLELNAVASISDLPVIREQVQKTISQVDFNTGHRYADFNHTTDKMATYGVAALVAGGVAGKMGLFKVILGVLIAAKKIVIVGIFAVYAGIKKMFTKTKE